MIVKLGLSWFGFYDLKGIDQKFVQSHAPVSYLDLPLFKKLGTGFLPFVLIRHAISIRIP